MVGLSLSSKDFRDGSFIPARFTCDGEDISPTLSWEAVPDGTVEFALECFDVDAPGGGWVHWVLYNIEKDVRELATGKVPRGSRQGLNDFGRTTYGGPCPPKGKAHRYVFTLYALNKHLNQLRDLKDLRRSISGCELGRAQLTGLYQRR